MTGRLRHVSISGIDDAADAQVGVLTLPSLELRAGACARCRSGPRSRCRRCRAAPPVSIWELIPITSPAASISGPPELPGLIAASVWITLSIEKPLGAWIWRCSAETMPVVTVRSSPNGLPIATTGSPTCDAWRSHPAAAGGGDPPAASTLSSATSVERVLADHLGRATVLSSPSVTSTLLGAVDDVGVGEDVAVVVDHEARSRSRCPLLLLRASPNGSTAICCATSALDEGDARRVVLVDLVDASVAARRRWRRGGRQRAGAGSTGRRSSWRRPAGRDGDHGRRRRRRPPTSGAEQGAEDSLTLRMAMIGALSEAASAQRDLVLEAAR